MQAGGINENQDGDGGGDDDNQWSEFQVRSGGGREAPYAAEWSDGRRDGHKKNGLEKPRYVAVPREVVRRARGDRAGEAN